jgi:hypothetical protein
MITRHAGNGELNRCLGQSRRHARRGRIRNTGKMRKTTVPHRKRPYNWNRTRERRVPAETGSVQ